MRKIFSVALVIVIAFTVSAPRAAATGVGGAALTLSEMAGVVSLIAGSLGIVFTGAGDMHDACEAYVRGLDPNSSAYLALTSAVAQGGTIYVAGYNAVNYIPGLVDSIRSFFLPGDNVVAGGGGVSITNLGQIYQGTGSVLDPGIARFDATTTPISFTDASGNSLGNINMSIEFYRQIGGAKQYFGKATISVPPDYVRNYDSLQNNYSQYGEPFMFLTNLSGYIVPAMAYWDYDGSLRTTPLTSMWEGIRLSDVSAVSGGGEVPVDIPVFQEAGALSPDLVGGVWDKLAEDAAAQNGNVTIDTNVGTYQGGATGYVDGDPNGVISAPQVPSLGGAGSTKTETDTSTGTTTQTQTQTGTQAVPQSQTVNPAISDVQAQTTFNGVALTLSEIFPFCIPFDIYVMFKGLSVPRQAPSFEIPLKLGSWLNFSHTFEFEQYEQYAQVLRSGELAVFVIGLAAATRKFIKW